jgi:hypothetical protein
MQKGIARDEIEAGRAVLEFSRVGARHCHPRRAAEIHLVQHRLRDIDPVDLVHEIANDVDDEAGSTSEIEQPLGAGLIDESR